MSATALTKEVGREAVPAVPDELESPTSKLVYLYLATAEGGTVEDLHEGLGLSNITLYPILECLTDRGVVACEDGEYRARGA